MTKMWNQKSMVTKLLLDQRETLDYVAQESNIFIRKKEETHESNFWVILYTNGEWRETKFDKYK